MRVPQIFKIRKSPWGEAPVSTSLIAILLVANMIQAAKIFDQFWSGASRFTYGIQAFIALIYICIAVKRSHFRIALTAIAVLFYLLLAHEIFVINTHSRANFNTIFTYMPLLSFIIFYESAVPINKILRIQLIICAAYMLFYIATYSAVLRIAGGSGAVLSSHDGTEGRVYLSAAYASFLALYAVRAKRHSLGLRGALLALAGIAITMSGTRIFLAVLMLVLTFSATSLMNKPVRVLFFISIGCIMIAILGGVVWSGWNPFMFMLSDNSATYRAKEYVFAVHAIQSHWLFGVGTPSDFSTLQEFLGTPKYEPLYPADLGIIAPFFEFGLPGLCAFIVMTYFCLLTPMISSDYEMQALQLNCMTCAIYGIASPAMLFEPSSVFVMIFVAAWLRQKNVRLSFFEMTRFTIARPSA